MSNHFNDMTSSESWQLLVNTAIRALTEAGYEPQRQPGRGRANVWTIEEGGRQQRVSVRTTRDRWFAFPPLDNGTKWKTLDDVDIVVVAAVDDSNEPNRIEVYRFDANEVRKRFDAAYSARIRAGQSEPDNFGMWVGLDVDSRGLPSSVGSGLASEYTAIAVYSLDQLIPENRDAAPNGAEDGEDLESSPGTIAAVMKQARGRIAALSGVNIADVKLSCSIET